MVKSPLLNNGKLRGSDMMGKISHGHSKWNPMNPPITRFCKGIKYRRKRPASESTTGQAKAEFPVQKIKGQVKDEKPDYDQNIHSDPDALKWAKFFVETCDKNGFPHPPEDLMHTWFANAMMAMHDHMEGKRQREALESSPPAEPSSETGTPETDARFNKWLAEVSFVTSDDMHDAYEFSSTLERRLNEALGRVKELEHLDKESTEQIRQLQNERFDLKNKLTGANEKLSAANAALKAQAGELEGVRAELAKVDRALGNASAFDDCKDRYEKIRKAMSVAAQSDALSVSCNRFNDQVNDLTAKLKAAEECRDKAVRSLVAGGYQDHGGTAWKPPLGPVPDFIQIERLQDTITRIERSIGHGPIDLEHIVAYCNQRLSSPWRPVSDPPKAEDADRNGNVEWLFMPRGCVCEASSTHDWSKYKLNCPSHWRPTDLSTLPVEEVDGDGVLEGVAGKEKAWNEWRKKRNFPSWPTQHEVDYQDAFKFAWQAALASVKGGKEP